jgi:predicted CopG family antitoxin
MGTKTVTITEDAYKKLKMEKMEGESFSEVIDRLTDKDKGRKDLMEFAGAWKDFDVEEIIKEGRKEFNKNAKILP